MTKRNLVGKILGTALVFVMVGAMVGGLPALVREAGASLGTIYVPDDYTTIKLAASSAISGDTIIVRDGNYHENVDVAVAGLTIQSENGTAKCIVNATDPNDHVFAVTADWVNITGFTVENASGSNKAGMYLGSAHHCNISSNNIRNNNQGINLSSSSNNIIYNNYFDNTLNAYDDGTNTWNIIKTEGTNIIGGQYLGGNYWLDYTGRDTDTPTDGLGDTKLPYNCAGNIASGGDYHPLVCEWAFEIQPSTVYVEPDEWFHVNVTAVRYSGDTCTWCVNIEFDPDYLNVTDLTLPTTLPNGDTPYIFPYPGWNNTDGWVRACYALPPAVPMHRLSETFVFATINFSCKGACGASEVKFTWVDPANCTEAISLIVVDCLNWDKVVNGTVSCGEICNCGDICVNESGWWRNLGTFNPSSTPIQDAVNDAVWGDTICVNDGTYYENVDVSVAGLTIQSENGTANCVVNASNPGDHVFAVNADWVNITGFTVENATGTAKGGIYLSTAAHCNVSNNNLTNNYEGIHLEGSPNNTLINNTALNNGYIGITLGSSNNCILTNNTAKLNYIGIGLGFSSNNTLTNNTANQNAYVGIGMNSSSNYNVLSNNTAKFNHIGIGWESSSNNTVTNNTANQNDYVGIGMNSSSNYNVLSNNTANLNYAGIGLESSNNNNITNNNATSNSYGINLTSSNNNTVTNNTASKNEWDGINLTSSNNNTLTNNTASGSYNGIHLWHSSYNTLTDNTASDNTNCDIRLYSSGHNTLDGSEIDETLCIESLTTLDDWIQDIDTSNKVNGKPVYYLVGKANQVIDSSSNAGYVGVVNSTNITVKDLILSNNGQGVLMCYTNNSRIENVTVSNNHQGIYLYSSSNNTLSNNTASNNTDGIHLEGSGSNTLTENTMSGNVYNFKVVGQQPSDYIQDIDASNEVDGNPMCYWVNRQNEQVPHDAGYVGILNSTNITVRDLVLTNNREGVLFIYTNNSRIENVTASNNDYGIYLSCSSNNTVTNNTLWNNDYGIYLDPSSGNTIYNNYFNNTNNAYDDGTNTWNTTNTTGPNIIGGPYLGGNYWSDYSGVDINGDGFGDTPYNITGGFNKDYLPLVPSAPPPPPPVGGTAYPENTLGILAPWIVLLAAIIAGASVLMLRRRRT